MLDPSEFEGHDHEYDQEHRNDWEWHMSLCSQFIYKNMTYCGAVGSEYCDWECPFSHEIGDEVSRDEDVD